MTVTETQYKNAKKFIFGRKKKKLPCTLQLSLYAIIKLYILHNMSNKYHNVHFAIMFYAKYFEFFRSQRAKD